MNVNATLNMRPAAERAGSLWQALSCMTSALQHRRADNDAKYSNQSRQSFNSCRLYKPSFGTFGFFLLQLVRRWFQTKPGWSLGSGLLVGPEPSDVPPQKSVQQFKQELLPVYCFFKTGLMVMENNSVESGARQQAAVSLSLLCWPEGGGSSSSLQVEAHFRRCEDVGG